MALVSIENGVRHALRLLKKCPEKSGVQIFSYKRNRSITVTKTITGSYVVKEEGYLSETREIDASELAKNLKTRFKREFPRSRKLRIVMAHDEDSSSPRVLKKL